MGGVGRGGGGVVVGGRGEARRGPLLSLGAPVEDARVVRASHDNVRFGLEAKVVAPERILRRERTHLGDERLQRAQRHEAVARAVVQSVERQRLIRGLPRYCRLPTLN